MTRNKQRYNDSSKSYILFTIHLCSTYLIKTNCHFDLKSKLMKKTSLLQFIIVLDEKRLCTEIKINQTKFMVIVLKVKKTIFILIFF